MLKKTGLLILALAFILMLGYGLFNLLNVIISDTQLPVILKVGLSGLILGLIILFLVILRERIEDYRQGK